MYPNLQILQHPVLNCRRELAKLRKSKASKCQIVCGSLKSRLTFSPSKRTSSKIYCVVVWILKRIFIVLYGKRGCEGLLQCLLLVILSACGGLRTSRSMPVLTAYFYVHHGKWCLVRDNTTRRLLYWANGLFYPCWNRLYRLIAYRYQDGRLPGIDVT